MVFGTLTTGGDIPSQSIKAVTYGSETSKGLKLYGHFQGERGCAILQVTLPVAVDRERGHLRASLHEYIGDPGSPRYSEWQPPRP